MIKLREIKRAGGDGNMVREKGDDGSQGNGSQGLDSGGEKTGKITT